MNRARRRPAQPEGRHPPGAAEARADVATGVLSHSPAPPLRAHPKAAPAGFGAETVRADTTPTGDAPRGPRNGYPAHYGQAIRESRGYRGPFFGGLTAPKVERLGSTTDGQPVVTRAVEVPGTRRRTAHGDIRLARPVPRVSGPCLDVRAPNVCPQVLRSGATWSRKRRLPLRLRVAKRCAWQLSAGHPGGPDAVASSGQAPQGGRGRVRCCPRIDQAPGARLCYPRLSARSLLEPARSVTECPDGRFAERDRGHHGFRESSSRKGHSA